MTVKNEKSDDGKRNENNSSKEAVIADNSRATTIYEDLICFSKGEELNKSVAGLIC